MDAILFITRRANEAMANRVKLLSYEFEFLVLTYHLYLSIVFYP